MHKYICHKYMDSIELFPTNKMDASKKVIVTIRLVAILSIIGYMVTSNSLYLWMGIVTAGCIGGVYYYNTHPMSDGTSSNTSGDVEEFTNINTKSELDQILSVDYKPGTKLNPLSNVLLTEYTDDPTRKSAPPAFNNIGINTVNKTVKKTVQELNPGIENTSEQLFGGLYNNFELKNANRIFFSTPNTKIPNDQTAFANFLYGDMPSCKEDGIQCVKDNLRYNLY